MIAGTNGSGDELWSMAFSNVGRTYGKPQNEEDIAEAIQAISGSTSMWQPPQRLPNINKASFIKRLETVQRILAMLSSPNCI